MVSFSLGDEILLRMGLDSVVTVFGRGGASLDR